MRAVFRTVLFVSITTLVACGGTKSEAQEPSASGAAGSGSSGEQSAAPSSDTASTGGEKAEAATAATEEKPFKSPKDVLTNPDVLFVFSFNESEPYQKAEEKCAKKAGDDPQKKAECMSKASSQFEPDGIHFKQDDKGKWWWLTEQRKGEGLVTLHKIEVEFGEEKDTSITIKPKGRDMGKKPMNVPNEVVIEVPTPSQIVINDAKNGKMVYEAKLGLLGEAAPASK